MPLKKKPKQKRKGNLRVKVHDIDAMNKTELKYYILKLRSELNNLRESMHRHSIENDRLNSFLKQQEQECLQRTKYDVSNNCDFFNFAAKFKSQLEEAHRKSIVVLQERHERNANRLLKEYIQRSIPENGADKIRIKQIQNSRRNIKEEEILTNVSIKGMSVCDLKGNSMKLLDATVLDYTLKLLNTMILFSYSKRDTLSNIYDLSGHKSWVQEGHSANVLRDIEVYFHQLNFDARRVILELRQKLAKLQEKQRSLSVLLNKAIEENKSLLLKPKMDFEQITVINCTKYYRVESNKQKVNPEVKKLMLRRDELKQKLNDLLDKRDNLRKMFLSAVVKFHEKGQYRAFVAEEALKVTISVQNKYSPTNYSENRGVAESENELNSRNFHDNFTQRRLELRNSKRLYIPPQFQYVNNFERISKWIKTI